MADLLLELFSEEIPARMQMRAAEDLKSRMADGLKEAGVTFETAEVHATPRRLVLALSGVITATPDLVEERKGPKVGAPDKAIEGFLRSAGLTKDDLTIEATPKGEVYMARIEKPGRQTCEIISELVPDIVRNFPWPKSQRWGASSLRWVRPLHTIVCLFDGRIVPFEIEEVKSGAITYGHRFMAPGAIEVTGFDQYQAALHNGSVILNADDRAQKILQGARDLAAKQGLTLVENEALARENAGLVEWPVVLMGRFDEEFLDVPAEVLQTTMADNQKYFALANPDGSMAPHFILVSNLVAQDGGAKIIDGNERVLRARLSDARFFWEQDKKHKLEDNLPKLADIVFHKELGTVRQKADRIASLSGTIAGMMGADTAQAERAGLLAKADLVSSMVFEFPEVQGVMGRYYARLDGEADSIAEAIGSHYQPQGPSDDCPTAPVAVAVAMADKIDTLAGFFAIRELPTGSKDPYALRRAALGVIRLVLENDLRVGLRDLFAAAAALYGKPGEETADLLLDFFADRLKVHLRAEGVRHDLIASVFALGGQDDLVLLLKRVEALSGFVGSDDGANLLAGAKRAGNILAKEEKKDGVTFGTDAETPDRENIHEFALFAALDDAESTVRAALNAEDFTAAMQALADLRDPVDMFFDKVIVNADDAAVRENRLKLLARLRKALGEVAEFSLIEG